MKQLLSPETCAECKGCCCFSKDDAWEIDEQYNLNFGENDTAYCPAHNLNGCTLGEKKPYECLLYPFRIMAFNGYFVIAVARYCPVILKMPLSTLCDFVEENYDDFLYMGRKPGVIKKYRDNYVILKVTPLTVDPNDKYD